MFKTKINVFFLLFSIVSNSSRQSQTGVKKNLPATTRKGTEAERVADGILDLRLDSKVRGFSTSNPSRFAEWSRWSSEGREDEVRDEVVLGFFGGLEAKAEENRLEVKLD